jgi:integrase
MSFTLSASAHAGLKAASDIESTNHDGSVGGPVPRLKDFANGRFLPYIQMAQLDPDTKRYYQNGWRLLRETSVAEQRLDLIRTPDAEILRFPGGGSNANCALRTLRRILSLAREWELLPKAPRIKLLQEEQRSAIFTAAQEAAFLRFAPQPLLDIFLILQDSGLRPDEVVRMRWANVLWDKNLIFNPDGKTRRARRHVPLSRRVHEILSRRAINTASGWVFPSSRKKGDHISYFHVAKHFTSTRKAAGLPDTLVLYSARHSFATDMMDRTGNLILVQRLLGHESPCTTQRYVHPEMKMIAEIVNLRNSEHAEKVRMSDREKRHAGSTG